MNGVHGKHLSLPPVQKEGKVPFPHSFLPFSFEPYFASLSSLPHIPHLHLFPLTLSFAFRQDTHDIRT